MKKKEKIQYFMNYYFKYVLFGAIGIFIVFYFVNQIFFQRKEIVLSVLVLKDTQELDVDEMENELRMALGVKSEKQDITIHILDPTIAQNQAIIMTRVRAKSVDILIAPEDVFTEYVGFGIYQGLTSAVVDEILLEEKGIKGKILTLDESGNLIKEGEERTYGLDLTGNEKYKQFQTVIEHPVIGIVSNSMHIENGKEAIQYFYGKDKTDKTR